MTTMPSIKQSSTTFETPFFLYGEKSGRWKKDIGNGKQEGEIHQMIEDWSYYSRHVRYCSYDTSFHMYHTESFL